MGAEDVGQKLLAEVEQESLFESLAALRHSVDPEHVQRIGFNYIDDLLTIFTTTRSRPLPNTDTPVARPCIEIASPASNDGKSQLLYLLVALMVLPPTFHGVRLRGQHAAVVYFDVDGHFAVVRLFDVMLNLVSLELAHAALPSAQRPTLTDLKTMICSAMQHVHVFRPQSMASLLATIRAVPAYLLDGAHHSRHRSVASIMLDSATAFYWNERDESETSRINQTEERGNSVSTYTQLRDVLRSLSMKLSCAIIYTTSNIFHKIGPDGGRTLPSSLPKAWSQFPTLRLVVRRRNIRGFPTAISAEEAARDTTARAEAVSKGIFEVRVNEDGHEEWPRDVRDAMRALETGRFALPVVIDSAGVVAG